MPCRLAFLMVLGLAASAEAASKRPQAPEVDLDAMPSFAASTFRMGVEALPVGSYGDAWFIDQQPAHDVSLGAFRLDRREVTVADFALFLSYAGGEAHFRPDQPIERVSGGYLPQAGHEHEPARHVTWSAARDYCLWAGKRLPTEAEWERAAAGLEGRTYPWGEEGAGCWIAVCFTGNTFCADGPLDVGSRPAGASPEGVLDLAGNVAEWVADRYGPYPAEPQQDPTGPAEGALRVVRGGGFLDSGVSLLSKARWGAAADRPSANVGFRCAWSAPSDDGALRGPLVSPPDEGRVPTDRPLVKPGPGPTAIGRWFLWPSALVALGDSVYVLDRDAARVVRIVRDSGDASPVVEGLGEPFDLATDGESLFITDPAAGAVLRATPGGPADVLAGKQPSPGWIVADGGTAFFSTAAAVVRVDPDGATKDLASAVGITGLAVSDTDVFYGIDGGMAGAVVRVGRGGGPPETLVGKALFGSGYYPTSVAALDATVVFTYRGRAWPGASWICTVPVGGGPPTCPTHSPTDPAHLKAAAGQVFWSTSYTVVRMDPRTDPTFVEIAPWTWTGGLAVDAGHVYWSNLNDGKVYEAAQ